MDEWLTVFLTIISGVMVFILCEYVKEIWLTPLQKYKELKARVSYLLTYYANIYTNPIDISKTNNKLPEKYEKCSDELRIIATELKAFIEGKSWLSLGIPNNKVISDASSKLIGLSNGLTIPSNCSDIFRRIEHNDKKSVEICELLKIYNIS